MTTAQGKPNSALRIIYIGTLAPLATGPGHWWHDLIMGGPQPSTYVQRLVGDPDRWDQAWSEIRRCNPLMVAVDPNFKRKLLQERDAARG